MSLTRASHDDVVDEALASVNEFADDATPSIQRTCLRVERANLSTLPLNEQQRTSTNIVRWCSRTNTNKIPRGLFVVRTPTLK